MITSKGMKTLCYIVMGLAFFAAVVLLLLGIALLADRNSLGIVLLVLAIILPLVTTVSLYPIFALASIDENILALNRKIDKIISIKQSPAQEKPQAPPPPEISKNRFTPEPPPEKEDGNKTPFERTEVIDFVNKRYNISIFAKDDFYTIKEKIANIDDGGFSALFLKKKVQEASSMDEIIDILVMHKVAHS